MHILCRYEVDKGATNQFPVKATVPHRLCQQRQSDLALSYYTVDKVIPKSNAKVGVRFLHQISPVQGLPKIRDTTQEYGLGHIRLQIHSGYPSHFWNNNPGVHIS